jgi:hypothetical protein
MKSKILFIVVFVSLLLNIFHSFFVENELHTNKLAEIHTPLCEGEKNSHDASSYHLDLHQLFHFVALIDSFHSLENYSKTATSMLFFDNIFPQQILESSFKPPRS